MWVYISSSSSGRCYIYSLALHYCSIYCNLRTYIFVCEEHNSRERERERKAAADNRLGQEQRRKESLSNRISNQLFKQARHPAALLINCIRRILHRIYSTQCMEMWVDFVYSLAPIEETRPYISPVSDTAESISSTSA